VTVDWHNEEYVRVYTRETADDLDLSWQALALWRAVLVRFDRSGIIAARNGWLSVSRMTRIPLEVVEAAGPELLRDGRLKQVEGGFWAPNFIDAQTATKSDKVRQKASRDRRRSEAASQVLNTPSAETAIRHEASHDVTSGHAPVTLSHAPSQNVTLCSALLCDPSALRGSALLPVTPPQAAVNLQGPVQGSFEAVAEKVDNAVRERERKSREKKLKHLLPDGWVPDRSDANREAEALALVRGVDIGEQLKNLRDWAASNNAKKADWNATWRNWTRNAKPSRSHQGKSALDIQLERVRRLEAEERAALENSDES
jgi:hypothetical protein